VSSAANVEPEPPVTRAHQFSTPADGNLISVAEGYRRWARTYDSDPNPLLAREERYLSPLLTGLHGKQILDIACGTGRWLDRLTAEGCAGVGIDNSLAMLQVAKQKSNIATRLCAADCALLPFRTASFDLVICSFALGHVIGLEILALELARVSRPGMNLFVSDLHPEAYAHGWRVGFRDESAALQIKTSPRSSGEIARTFRASGFDYLACESLHLGDAEKPVFERAGKSHMFEAACSLPAVLVCHFRRIGLSSELRVES
jgi:ubiquinone/menaquinone biosynthesis C-methylase UbiE